MQLMIYVSPFSLMGRQMKKNIESMPVNAQRTYCASLSSLETYLRKPKGISPIGILAPSNDGELAALIGMRHLLRDMLLILILPKCSPDGIPQSHIHMLRPRYISYADGDLSDVTAVLNKMNAARLIESSDRHIVHSSNPQDLTIQGLN